jgi:hypothetical protein
LSGNCSRYKHLLLYILVGTSGGLASSGLSIGGRRDGASAGLEEGLDLLLAAVVTRKANESVSEKVIVLGHQGEENTVEVDALEDNSLVLGIGVHLSGEVLGVLTPVTEGIQMVRGVVAVVEGDPVVSNVDTGKGVGVVIGGIVTRSKRVLSPVTGHHTDSHHSVRESEEQERSRSINAAKEIGKGPEDDLTGDTTNSECVLLSLGEPHGQLDDAEEVEAEEVSGKVEWVVTLIPGRAGQIVRSVSSHVVHLKGAERGEHTPCKTYINI